MPKELRRPAPKPKEPEKLAEWTESEARRREEARVWRKQYVWSPNRLRHNAATRFRAMFGIDVAQTILGHQVGSKITEIYADQHLDNARRIMGEVG